MSTVESKALTTAEKLKFSMRGLPLLESGATMESLAIAPALWAHSKVYSDGGENKLHSHDLEDHCFLILQGEATFTFADGSTLVTKAFDGIMIPRGTAYRFTSGKAENLVMFRVGSATVKDSTDIDPIYGMPNELSLSRARPDGEADPAAGGAHARPTVHKIGEYFPKDYKD